MEPRHHKGAESTSPRHGLRHCVRITVPRLSRFAVEHLALLPLGAVIALVWVNTAPESYYAFTSAMSFAVNDVAMVLFFALMTKEVVEATDALGMHIEPCAPSVEDFHRALLVGTLAWSPPWRNLR